MLIGLDCAAPELVFDHWLNDLPNLKRLCQNGIHGPLRSCDPPITVPAWSVMMSSKSPGRLGVYGFRNRADHWYDRYLIANSLAIKRIGYGIFFREVENVRLSLAYRERTHLNHSTDCWSAVFSLQIRAAITHIRPNSKMKLRASWRVCFGRAGFSLGNKNKILGDIYEMTRKRFQLARHLLARKFGITL